MKTAVVAAVWLFLGPVLHAQQPPPTPPVFLPPQGPAALTVPNPLAGLQPGPRDLYQLPSGGDRFQQVPPQHARPTVFIGPGVVAPGMIWPGAFWPTGHPYDATLDRDPRRPRYAHPARAQAPARGGLRLETLPASAQVFVDGYYVGTAEEFGLTGRPIELVPGPHIVEVHAPGYQPLSFRIMITENGIIRYRGDMTPLDRQPPAPAVTSPSAPAQPVYIIPNCFAGNRLPSRPLPAGCERSKLQTRR